MFKSKDQTPDLEAMTSSERAKYHADAAEEMLADRPKIGAQVQAARATEANTHATLALYYQAKGDA